jgi:hypothetical protein
MRELNGKEVCGRALNIGKFPKTRSNSFSNVSLEQAVKEL